jgi:hypothetical protein
MRQAMGDEVDYGRHVGVDRVQQQSQQRATMRPADPQGAHFPRQGQGRL